jgi:AcrR family transcriptional regulator
MPRVIPEYKEEAKTRIMTAANQVFAEKGYRNATMEEVAKKMGVSKGALYLYFASKEDLFEAICRSEPLALKEILYSTFNEERDPLNSASVFFDKMTERYGTSQGLTFEIFSEASHNSGLKRILRKTHDDYVEILAGFLGQLQEKQFISDESDLHDVANALIGMWNGIETLMLSGVSSAEAKRAWLAGFKAMFIPRHVSTQPSALKAK